MAQAENNAFSTVQNVLARGVDAAGQWAHKADTRLADAGVSPLGGVALGASAVGAGLLLKHLLNNRRTVEDPRDYYEQYYR